MIIIIILVLTVFRISWKVAAVTNCRASQTIHKQQPTRQPANLTDSKTSNMTEKGHLFKREAKQVGLPFNGVIYYVEDNIII